MSKDETKRLLKRVLSALKQRLSRVDIQVDDGRLVARGVWLLVLLRCIARVSLQVTYPVDYKKSDKVLVGLSRLAVACVNIPAETSVLNLRIVVKFPRWFMSGRLYRLIPKGDKAACECGEYIYSSSAKDSVLFLREQFPALSRISPTQVQDGNAFDFIFNIDGADGRFSYEFITVRRADRKAIGVSGRYIGNALSFRLPLGDVFYESEARWDCVLQIRYLQEVVYRSVLDSAGFESGGDHHFHVGDIGREFAASFFLTERRKSLAMYVAPAEKHKKMVAIENAKKAYPALLDSMPLDENLVFFESFLGKTYSGNPRYVYEELLKNPRRLKFVWSYDGSASIPGDPTIVSRGSPEYYRYLASAKYRVNNVIFPVHGKKKETVYLQTWHGTPLKKLSFDIEVSGPEMDARENFYQESRSWDVLLSANTFSTEVFKRAFRYSGEIFEGGYPLADGLLDSATDRDALVEQLGLPAGKKFILYAPTWRDHKSIGAWQHAFDLQLDLQLFSAQIPSDTILLIKAHHLISEQLDKAALPERVVDMSNIDDINELCSIADILITDYSSVFFDFAVTGRPILFYCYDLELYATSIRGFYLDVNEDLPGPIAKGTPELIDMVLNIDKYAELYRDKYDQFKTRFCAFSDGRSAKKVVNHIFGVAHDN